MRSVVVAALCAALLFCSPARADVQYDFEKIWSTLKEKKYLQGNWSQGYLERRNVKVQIAPKIGWKGKAYTCALTYTISGDAKLLGQKRSCTRLPKSIIDQAYYKHYFEVALIDLTASAEQSLGD